MIDGTKLSSLTARYPYLQGLLFVPIGLWLMLSSSVRAWWPWRTELLLIPAALVAAWAYLRIKRYYDESFGRVGPPRSAQIRDLAWTLVALALLAIALQVDTNNRVPVSLFGFSFGAVMLVYWRFALGLRPHHVAVVAALWVVSAVPLWSDLQPNDMFSIIGFSQGAALVITGLFDHADLVRSLSSLRGPGNGSLGQSSGVHA
jgi:predicted esterase